MTKVIRLTQPPQTRPHPRAHEIISEWIIRAEQNAARVYPNRVEFRAAVLCGKYEGAIIALCNSVPGAAEFLARVEGIEFE